MTSDRHSSLPDDVPGAPRDAAAWWFARLHSGAMSRQDQRDLTRWRQADPEHEREFQAAQALGNVAASLDRERVRALLGGSIPVRPTVRRRQLLRTGLALACTTAAVAGIGLYWPADDPHYTATLATRKGERRAETLPDGSVLELNTDTEARVSLYGERRVVALRRGEIMFTVSPDPARPFIVDADVGRVRVVGTRFDVRRDADRMNVSVESGIVDVSPASGWNRATRRLTAGLGLDLAGGRLGEVRRVDVASLTAWRGGRIVFEDASLADMVREINRYRDRPLRVADARLDALRVTASFRLDTPDAVAQSLPKILPVGVRTLADGTTLIEPR
ncbi:inner membrane sensor for iron transport [Bordetella ansorpii]|uniref:Inner membrane sensor for iron transport n=1 Tax=Bordetella ansorpii TaxID=288768 RepID=A0A157NWL0_9BORD|nr:FecR family protein [Bordetella ansorpii]SAI25673.1 inner membrane sensor for iron transport [Bordetella ansorpii]